MRRKIFALPEDIIRKLALEAESWAGGDDRGREADIVRDALARRYGLISGDHFPLTEYEKDLVIAARLLVQRDPETAHAAAYVIHATTRRTVTRQLTPLATPRATALPPENRLREQHRANKNLHRALTALHDGHIFHSEGRRR